MKLKHGKMTRRDAEKRIDELRDEADRLEDEARELDNEADDLEDDLDDNEFASDDPKPEHVGRTYSDGDGLKRCSEWFNGCARCAAELEAAPP